LKDIAIGDFYKQIGVLFQTFNHYPLDLKTNVMVGDITNGGGKHDWAAAVALADASPIVEGLPRKEKTILDIALDDGVDLSGGQWQRIALARAFYRDAPLLILDEPTAAVDANAEYEIFENIRENQADKTTIIISHRFSTVRQAEQIIVLRKGRVIEQGDHPSLLKKGGLYAEMFNKQAEGYK
jgi:ABC-type multidrug transport system fused ATPase/permease subunit